MVTLGPPTRKEEDEEPPGYAAKGLFHKAHVASFLEHFHAAAICKQAAPANGYHALSGSWCKFKRKWNKPNKNVNQVKPDKSSYFGITGQFQVCFCQICLSAFIQ